METCTVAGGRAAQDSVCVKWQHKYISQNVIHGTRSGRTAWELWMYFTQVCMLLVCSW